MTPTAWAEDALTVGVAATGRTGGAGHESAGGRLDARYRWENGISLGLAVEGTALDHLFIGGFSERSGAGAGGTLSASFPMLQMGPLSLDLGLATGVAWLTDTDDTKGPEDEALRSSTELSFHAHVLLGQRWLLRAGVILGFDLELGSGELADQSQLLSVGAAFSATDWLMVVATMDAGGTFGFDGDNGKLIVRGTVGLRFDLEGGDVRRAF
jgi:hypothetical protein